MLYKIRDRDSAAGFGLGRERWRNQVHAGQRHCGALSELSIRRAGTQDWKPLGNAPAPGARGAIDYSDPDCAFDIRAKVPGKGPVTWADVNLCDVKSVTLKRDNSTGAWVDYDH